MIEHGCEGGVIGFAVVVMFFIDFGRPLDLTQSY